MISHLNLGRIKYPILLSIFLDSILVHTLGIIFLNNNKLYYLIRKTYFLQDIARYMNEENSKLVWNFIKEAGDKLVGKLPHSRNHPKGRNPYAHVAICVKSRFGQSYKEIPDENLEQVLEYINFLVENPS
jgi:hypothetical protein